jgi:cytochrome c553
MKKFATLLAVLMVAVFSAGVLVAADAPEKITIKVIQKEKAPVEFGHKAHADKIGKCAECHHKDEAGKEQKCSGCHKAKMEKEKESFKEVMHTKCRGCHKKEKKGPEKCEGCHPKK